MANGNHDPNDNSKLDPQAVSSAICNSEDLGPFIRRAFASGKPETLLQSLRHFSRTKESEIEDVCKSHYQDFIRAVDDLRSLLSEVDSLKSSLHDSNSMLQSVAGPLLSTLDAYVESQSQSRNLAHALSSARLCVQLFDLCRRANTHLEEDHLYLALKCVDAIEKGGFLYSAPSPAICRMLEATIPEIRSHAKRRIDREFGDWLVGIRVVSRNLGQIAIGRASSARQRDEDLRIKQRQVEEQSRNSFRSTASVSDDSSSVIYTLHDEDEDDITAVADLDGGNGSGAECGLGFDLTPLYKAYHVHRTLGLQDRFKKYYFENRKLQLTSDFQVSTMTPFLESHQNFFAQIAGFFIVEDRIFRTGGGLISKFEVDSLWDAAVLKMVSVIEDQFSRMQIAHNLLMIKDYVSLLGVTLRRYGYSVESLLDVLSKHRDKYHDLLLADCRTKILEALSVDIKFEQMFMKKEYEYSMNVLAFQLQSTESPPAYPFVAPFSSLVPDCCRIVRSFVEDSFNFMSYSGQLEFYDIVKKYLDRLLSEVLDGALLILVESSIQGVAAAIQVSANMVAFEKACVFFFRHTAQLCGIPFRMTERGPRDFPLKRSRDAAEAKLVRFMIGKIDDFMVQTENISWMVETVYQNGNEYANEVILYLEALFSTAQELLPSQVLRRITLGVILHISEKIVGLFLDDNVRRFNDNAVVGIDADLKLFESFVDKLAQVHATEDELDANELKLGLLEARQMVNLLMSNNPENYMNPVIRAKNYSKLDHKKVVMVMEKFNNSSDRKFTLRTARQNPKKKSLDALIKKLKDVS